MFLTSLLVFTVEPLTSWNAAMSVSRAAVFVPNVDDLAPPCSRLNQPSFRSYGELLMLTPSSILPLPWPSGRSAAVPACSTLPSHRGVVRLRALNRPLGRVRVCVLSAHVTFASLGTSPLGWSAVPELHRAAVP